MPSKQRESWIDAARALAVVLVVFYHVLIWLHPTVILDSEAGLARLWGESRLLLGRLRMPLLMTLSGFLAAGAIARGWAGVRLRLAANYWLYAVWTLLFFAMWAGMQLLTGSTGLAKPIEGPGDLAKNLVIPDTILWFIFAMAIYPLMLWALRTLLVPTWMTLVLAASMWAIGMTVSLPFGVTQLAVNFIFFAIGVYGVHIVRSIASYGWVTGVIASVLFVVGAHTFERAIGKPALFIVSALGIVAVLNLFPRIFRSGKHTTVVAAIGRRTVEIYLLHLPILQVLFLVFSQFDLEPALRTKAGDALFIAGTVVVVVTAALAFGAGLRLIPGVLTFPARWREPMMR